MPARPFALACLVWFALLGAAAVARAQTGGSMGGDSFGEPEPAPPRSRSSSSRSSSSSPSSSRSSFSTSTPDYAPSYDYTGTSSPGHVGSSGGGGGFTPAMAVFAVGGLVVMGGFFLVSTARDRASTSGATTTMPQADVTVLRIGVDARTRKHVQGELDRIARTAQTGTADGRAAMLREVALLLRRVRDAWVYGGAENEPMTAKAIAEMTYRRHIADARAAFQDELIRNEGGAITTTAAAAPLATSDDGPGIMLITIVVAARHELLTVGAIGDGEELRKALESLSTMVGSELIGVEVVWMPAAADERLSSVAVEARLPPPRLFKIEGALVGKVFCGFCGAPYPAEAIACPSCGGRPGTVA